MFCASATDIIPDRPAILLKLLLAQISERFDAYDFLDFCQRCLALAAAFVIFGVSKSAFFICAGNYDLGPFEADWRVFIL